MSMENNIFVFCEFRGEVAVYTISSTAASFSKLVKFIAEKWSFADIGLLKLSYGIAGYSKCMLQCDSDMHTMALVCKQINVNFVDIEVSVREREGDMIAVEVGGNRNECNGSWALQVVDDFDNEPNFFAIERSC